MRVSRVSCPSARNPLEANGAPSDLLERPAGNNLTVWQEFVGTHRLLGLAELTDKDGSRASKFEVGFETAVATLATYYIDSNFDCPGLPLGSINWSLRTPTVFPGRGDHPYLYADQFSPQSEYSQGLFFDAEPPKEVDKNSPRDLPINPINGVWSRVIEEPGASKET